MLNRPITFADVFSGIGGFRLAYESLGCKCIYSCEIDKSARDTYKLNFGEFPTDFDITKVDPDSIPNCDIFCAGFPCTPFSLNGSRKGTSDKRGKLIFASIKIIETKKPMVVLLENVKGLLSIQNGKTFSNIVNTLNSLGYSVFHTVLNSKDFGVPQNRERVYIVCFRNDIQNNNGFVFPKPIYKKVSVKDILESNVGHTRISPKKHSKLIKEMIYYDQSRLYKDINPIIKLWKYIAPFEIKEFQQNVIYSILGVTPCLHTKDSHMFEVIDGDHSSWRKLTIREEARCQGFPDNYQFTSNASKLIGNSVTVPVIKIIGEQILKVLNESNFYN